MDVASASYGWVLSLRLPLVQRVKWYSQEFTWSQELQRWREQVEGFNHLGDRYFVTVANGMKESFDFFAPDTSLIWHILPRPDLRGQLPGVLSANTALSTLELDVEEAVVLATLS